MAGYRVAESTPCACEECRPGPGIDYALKELNRVLGVQAAARLRRAERRKAITALMLGATFLE